MYTELMLVVVVGSLWGITNPLIQIGSIAVQGALRRRSVQPGRLHVLWAHISTPAFMVPQVLNQLGSLLFIWLLGQASASVVSSANACALLFNACVDIFLGKRHRLQLLVPGVLLVSFGVLLCGVPPQDMWSA
ncbi:hypothetical protein V8C86DRAFT_2757346 [Haematococcus lacustris]